MYNRDITTTQRKTTMKIDLIAIANQVAHIESKFVRSLKITDILLKMEIALQNHNKICNEVEQIVADNAISEKLFGKSLF